MVLDIQSKISWEELKVPEEIIDNLVDEPLMYVKPSIIQTMAIPRLIADTTNNFVFQSMNGSGKTGAFSIPAIMRIDKSLKAPQVLILANTRELNNQTVKLITEMIKGTGITCAYAEGTKKITEHIIVGTPGYIKRDMEAAGRGGTTIDYSKLKMVIFDEADDQFNSLDI